MAQDIVLGIVLKADGSGLRGEVKLSQAELEKFGQASQKLGQRASMLGNEFGRAFSGLRTQLIGMATAFVSVQTALNVLRGIGREVMEAERATASLNAVLRATGGAAGLTAQQIGELAEELERTTLFDDTEILRASAVLATFRGIAGDTFREALAGATDLAALMGTDLQSAVLQLGKALEDPEQGLTALRRAGITFTEEERELIKALVDAGREAEALGIVLDRVSGKVGGVAAAQVTGLTGAVNELGDAWGDLLKDFKDTGGYDLVVGGINAIAWGVRNLSKLIENDPVWGAIIGTYRLGKSLGRDLGLLNEPPGSSGFHPRQRALGLYEPPAPPGARKPSDEEVKQAAALKDYISDLEFMRDQLARTAEQQAIYNALREAGVTIDSAAGRTIAGLVGQTSFLAQAQAELNAELEAELTFRAEGRQLTEALRTPFEAFQDDLGRANELLKEGAIDWQTYTRATAAAREAYLEAASGADEFGQAMGDAFHTIATGFEDALVNGERFSDVLQVIEQDIARIIIRLTVTKPIEEGLTGLLNEFDFGDLWRLIFGGGEHPVMGAKGLAVLQGRVLALAKGGVVDRPTLFPLAHGAGLMGEAGPEAIMPLARGPTGELGVRGAGGGGDVTVVINNYSGQQATAREGRGADGRRMIEVTVGDAAARDVAGRGPLAQSLERTYGLRRSGVVR